MASEPLRMNTPTPFPGEPDFRHRGFYLHEGWFFEYPFAVRTWQRADFNAMFQLLRHLGFDRVMIWPMLESIPRPLSEHDAEAVREFRETIDDAHAANLECWLTQTANCDPNPAIAGKPWRERNPYPAWTKIDLSDPAQAAPFLAHRTNLLEILNNADAYVTIDGDPGGYKGANPKDWLKVFCSDRAAIDKYGVEPKRQALIPWVWCGWGTEGVWQEPIAPFIHAEMAVIKSQMPEPWRLLPGRSYREGHANGRINIALAEEFGLIPRSTILCYEAIEFEPTPPTAVLQFDIIRRNLREESKYAKTADGIFGNAQQPIIVLPNLYFFARCTWDLDYIDKSDNEVLQDLATLLGGEPGLLCPAWACMQLGLEQLPVDLPKQLRESSLRSNVAACIPGGPQRYLEILAAQVESRIGLLQAIARPAEADIQAAAQIAAGMVALFDWWKVHRYVFDGNGDESFAWNFVHKTQVALLSQWAKHNVKEPAVVAQKAARIVGKRTDLSVPKAELRVMEIIR